MKITYSMAAIILVFTATASPVPAGTELHARDLVENEVAAAPDTNVVDTAAVRSGWLYIKDKREPQADEDANVVDTAATRSGWLYIKDKREPQADEDANVVDTAATRSGWLYIKE